MTDANHNMQKSGSPAPTAAGPPAPATRTFYSMGLNTYRVPLSLYSTNRSKALAALRAYYYGGTSAAADGIDGTAAVNIADAAAYTTTSSNDDNLTGNATEKVLYLEGGTSTTRHSSDHEPVFRQESYFHYLFGVREPDFCGCIELDTGRSVLFMPKLPQDYGTIMGRIKGCEEVKEEYGVDEVYYCDELEDYLMEKVVAATGGQEAVLVTEGANSSDVGDDAEDEKKDNGSDDKNDNDSLNSSAAASSSAGQILLLSGTNTDSGRTSSPPTLSSNFQSYINTSVLHDILAECRATKSPAELSLLRHVTELTSFAHTYTMSRTRPGMMEYQSESLFRHYCYYNFGVRNLGYTAICGCGPNGAVLHYGHAGAPNARQLDDGDMCLFDLGAEYCCYGSDVTCSFPANGRFSERQRVVYQGVLNAQIAVYDMLRPGVSYVDCHKAAEYEILKAMVSLGIVVPGSASIDELVSMRLGAIFMPHGLGHLIGIDTHDVGGYLPNCPPRIMEPGLKSLRTARIMEEDMIVTVEPGCYFINHLLDGATADESPLAQYLNASILNEFRGFGGVRLEDVVVVTGDGCVNYTLCPRTIEEVEDVCDGGRWPPVEDEAPELRRERLCDPTPLRPCDTF